MNRKKKKKKQLHFVKGSQHEGIYIRVNAHKHTGIKGSENSFNFILQANESKSYSLINRQYNLSGRGERERTFRKQQIVGPNQRYKELSSEK